MMVQIVAENQEPAVEMDTSAEAEMVVEGNEVKADAEAEAEMMVEEVKADEEMEEDESEKPIEKMASPRTAGSERPTRERRTVQRLTFESPRVSIPTVIEQGQGTELREIPNVAFKLSKRKPDDNLQLLHTILYGKKAKAKLLKRNIGSFSGFVWLQSEAERQRTKIKEKLDKCTKEKLLDFSDVLNIPVNKAAIKKEELTTKLLEFLESPHATTDTLLADKEKGKKRKSTSKSPGSSNATAKKATKKQKLETETENKQRTTNEGDEKSESSQSEYEHGDDKIVNNDESDKEDKVDTGAGIDEAKEAEEKNDESINKNVVGKDSSKKTANKDTGKSVEKPKSIAKESSVKVSGSSGKAAKPSSTSASKKGKSEAERKSKVKTPPTKNKEAEREPERDTSTPVKDSTTSKKKSSKGSASEKDQGKGESITKVKQPTTEEMHAVVVEILKVVNFNTATLSDILKQLGERFGVDLSHRKAEVKSVITEAINNMSEDEDGESDSASKSEDDE